METIVGRKEEQKIINQLITSIKSEFLAIYGRRRVGKTFLIRRSFEKQIVFQMTGIAQANTSQQLMNFFTVMREADENISPGSPPKNWFEAFDLLRNYLQALKEPKKVVFFDELPWIDTPRSNFLPALEHFWNSWASARPDIILVVCGSAASWMLNKVINNRGGLYNRITQRIRLLPFTLCETESLLRANKITIDRYQILQLYMIVGGVPFYLSQIRQGMSAFQEIDRLAFSKNGFLATEYDNLYHSLFSHPARHITIIETLAGKPHGLNRERVVQLSRVKDGGALTTVLRELEESGFISKSLPYGKKIRDSIYRLSDQYSLFYLKFIKDQHRTGAGSWLSRIDSPAWRAWSGYAYESICLQHIITIKKALGISGVYTEESSWIDKARSVQIDLLIDRRDHVINLCEVKFTQQPFVLTKAHKEDFEKKIFSFKEETQTRKSIFPTLVTTFSLKDGIHSSGFIQSVVTLDDLFETM